MKQIFSYEAPLSKVVFYQWVCCAFVSEILKDEFQTVFTVFVLDIVVQAVHILDTSHALNSKKQICKKAAFLFLVQLYFLWLLVIEFVVLLQHSYCPLIECTFTKMTQKIEEVEENDKYHYFKFSTFMLQCARLIAYEKQKQE